MDLEETDGVEQLAENCESCGAPLTEGEIAAALENTSEVVLCARCAAERVADEDELEAI
jgi:hypothetical protein